MKRAERPDVAYRGYVIRYNPYNDCMWVEKEGVFLGWIVDEAEGRRIIDALLD